MIRLLAATNPFLAAWEGLVDAIASGLTLLHDAFVPAFGTHSWGWAIIGLTVVIRVLLLPLALKQTRSMRAMQALQPQVKSIQKKYKADRELMRKDPETYRARKQKMNEEMMALYRREGVNPAAGCLPLVLQAPVFIALFRVLQTGENLVDAPFYVFSPLGERASADVWGWVLIVLMALTMFVAQRQMTARTLTGGDSPQAQQQKMLLYLMPVVLAFFAWGLPIGVLLYWVTTNLWQLGQQAIILREVQAHPASATATDRGSSGGPEAKPKVGPSERGKSSGGPEAKPKVGPSERGKSSGGPEAKPKVGPSEREKKAANRPKPAASPNGQRRRSEHLPRRSGGSKRGRSR